MIAWLNLATELSIPFRKLRKEVFIKDPMEVKKIRGFILKIELSDEVVSEVSKTKFLYGLIDRSNVVIKFRGNEKILSGLKNEDADNIISLTKKLIDKK